MLTSLSILGVMAGSGLVAGPALGLPGLWVLQQVEPEAAAAAAQVEPAPDEQPSEPVSKSDNDVADAVMAADEPPPSPEVESAAGAEAAAGEVSRPAVTGDGGEPATATAVEVIEAQPVGGESAAGAAPATAPAVPSDVPAVTQPVRRAPGVQDRRARRTTAASNLRRMGWLVRGAGAYHATAEVEYRMLAVVDPDSFNDRYIIWRLGADLEIFDGARLMLRLGLLEKFWAEEGESGVFLQDTRVGGAYRHEVPLAALGLGDRMVSFTHQLLLFLPTSRASVLQDMVFAPRLATQAVTELISRLSLAAYAGVNYRFHRYAERAGLDGNMNTQLVGEGMLTLEYTVMDAPLPFGTIAVGADVRTAYVKKYPSREEYESEESDRTFWNQEYGWDVYMTYSPVEYATLAVSLEQGAWVLRDGLVNTHLFHRDETELAFRLIGNW